MTRRQESYFSQARRDVEHETAGVIWTTLKIGIPVIVLLVLIGWGLQATNIININIKREVIQHSQEYSETKQSLLYKYYNDYMQLQTEILELEQAGDNTAIIEAKQAQQKNLVKQIRVEAYRIPESEIPTEIKQLIVRR